MRRLAFARPFARLTGPALPAALVGAPGRAETETDSDGDGVRRAGVGIVTDRHLVASRRPTIGAFGVILVIGLVALAGCRSTSTADERGAGRGQDPRGGIDLAAPLARWEQDPDKTLQGVVVLRNGHVVAERYYNGATRDSLNDIRSAGKSVTALLATIALDRGAIASAQDPVGKYWPEAARSPIGAATIDDLLTMRSGLDAEDEVSASPGHEDRMDEAPDPAAFALSVPAREAPGTVYRYNSLTASAAGLVVARATGEDLADFGAKALFGPLRLGAWRWDKDAAGHTKGQGNLWLTTRGLATIGEMVRCAGEYQGRRIVSAGGIAMMLKPRVPIADKDPYADAYGRMWYFRLLPVGSQVVPVWFASGNGGNKIYVVPRARLVVAITSQAYGRGHGQRRSQEILVSLLQASLPALPPPGTADAPVQGLFDRSCAQGQSRSPSFD